MQEPTLYKGNRLTVNDSNEKKNQIKPGTSFILDGLT